MIDKYIDVTTLLLWKQLFSCGKTKLLDEPQEPAAFLNLSSPSSSQFNDELSAHAFITTIVATDSQNQMQQNLSSSIRKLQTFNAGNHRNYIDGFGAKEHRRRHSKQVRGLHRNRNNYSVHQTAHNALHKVSTCIC